MATDLSPDAATPTQPPALPPFDSLQLTTARLQLRPLQHSDAQALFAMYGDPQVMRYWSSPAWTTVAQAEAMIEADAKSLAASEHLRLVLADKDSDHLLGTCSLFSFSPGNRRAEIGYALSPAAWGRGLMHEALEALVGYAFGRLDLHRLEADIDPRNLASARSLARLGFKLEGLLRERWIVAGEVSDTGLYGLLRSEWLAARGVDQDSGLGVGANLGAAGSAL